MDDIVFSKWHTREELKDIEQTSFPGVYLVTFAKRRPNGSGNPSSKHVRYIGETCSGTIRSRTRNFENGILRNMRGHSGGRFGYGKINEADGKIFYSFHVNDKLSGTEMEPYYIRYVERLSIWKYCELHHKQPEFNRK